MSENKPCIYGHTSGRYWGNGDCIECKKIWNKRTYKKRKSKPLNALLTTVEPKQKS